MKQEKRFPGEEFTPEERAKADQMNLDESLVPPWTVPQPRSRTAAGFLQKERPELLRAFARTIYGEIPPRCEEIAFELVESSDSALDGLARRRQFVIHCRHRGLERRLHLLLYLPRETREEKVPVFLGLNFKGNHSTTKDPGVLYNIPKVYPTLRNSPRFRDNAAPRDQRGGDADRWCFEEVLKRGYASATMRHFDSYPDHPYGFEDSILRLFFEESVWNSPERPSAAISAWAWSLERAIDCLETVPEIDTSRILVHGLSRLGKTALWAGANDERIALAASFCSGTCGAKLSHRYFGEDFSWLNLWNPHWTVPRFKEYENRDREIPVDQNQLIGCIAPRLTFIASATEDDYADPRGEFLAAAEASKFYRLFGSGGLGTETQPPAGQLITGDIGYYLRSGGHNTTPEDWHALLDYADKKMKDER